VLAIASGRSNKQRGARRELLATQPAFWLLVAALTTLLLWSLRERLDKAHMALAYLLVVLGASAQAGGRTGILLSTVCFLLFNFFLLPPYYTLHLANPLDWIVLGAFVVTGMVAARLLARAQQEADLARQRAAEVDRFAQLGAESLNAPGAEAALNAVADALRSELGADDCRIYMPAADAAWHCVGRSAGATLEAAGVEGVLSMAAARGVVVVERADGSLHLGADSADGRTFDLIGVEDALAVVVPLSVRGSPAGVLRLSAGNRFSLEAAQARFLAAMAYYAALGVERTRLAAQAAGAEALREADRLKDALLASISHDLRTPLTTIRALAAELREEQADERAFVIEKEADRLNRLVSNVLDLSRIRAGAMKPHVELGAAEDLLGAALQQLSGHADSDRIVTMLEDEGTILLGRFDFLQSVRILVNLIHNALRYSPAERPVHIRVRRSGENIVFSVEDEGPGIAPGLRDRIFQPFGGGDVQPTGGSGLGLSIARQLAEAQGGSVHYSERPGGGSVFVLELPAAELNALDGESNAH
jgi:two-component system sensor histidine kinase KdpD